MGSTHITVENVEGTTTGRWHTDETYKVTDDVAAQFAALKPRPNGPELQTWVQDHGGTLDDDGNKAARVSRKADGTAINDHYKDGEMTTSEVTHPKGAKADTHAGTELFLALMTGGASLFIPHDVDGHAPPESKFAGAATTHPVAHHHHPVHHHTPTTALASGTTLATTTTATTTAPAATAPKPPKPQ